jgi:hypothetical protein
MPSHPQPGSTAGNDDAHWLEVVDGHGLYPVKLLGPYATARQADRAQRGVMRLLNVGRYTVAVVSQHDLEDRRPHDEPGS